MGDPMYSPWKKPADVMRQMKSKKRALQARFHQSQSLQKSGANGKESFVVSDVKPTRQVNPFCKKRLCVESRLQSTIASPEVEEWSSDNTLFQFLNPAQKTEGTNLNCHSVNLGFHAGNKAASEEQAKSHVWSSVPPVDWSLKTKLRFLSSSPFTWNLNALKTAAEASGTTGFVRCLHSPSGVTQQSLDSSACSQMHQRRLVWMHPSLPWLPLFPRITGKQTGAAATSINAAVKQALYMDWCESLRSLFQLLRSRQCPYFYVCAPTFTVLFRASGIAGIPQEHAMIAPTTKGLRDALREEGIEFRMPLDKDQKDAPATTDGAADRVSDLSEESDVSSSQASTSDVMPDVSDEEEEDTEEVSTWMASVGLEKKLLDAGSHRKKIHKENKADHRPESLVYVESSEVQALYNFLLNSRVCISTTGPLGGIPPTLLAPVAFQAATLRPLKVKQGLVHGSQSVLHSLQLEGPILPHVLHSLVQLFSTTNGPYTITCATLENTTAFSSNALSPSFVPSAFARQSLTDCGLHPDIIELLCSTTSSTVVRELEHDKGQFKWS